jgi:hypothetical protein
MLITPMKRDAMIANPMHVFRAGYSCWISGWKRTPTPKWYAINDIAKNNGRDRKKLPARIQSFDRG